MNRTKLIIHRTNQALNQPVAIIIILVLLFAYFAYGNSQFQKQNRQIIESTQTAVQNTNKLVEGDNELLKAIKQVTIDANLTASQQTNIIICMLQVPVEQRTTNLESACRKQVTPVPTTTSNTSNTAPSPSPQPTSPAQTSPAPSPTPSPTSPVKRVIKSVQHIIDLLGRSL